MIIGDKYELYIPIAQASSVNIGLIFDDLKGYSFTYAGTVMLGHLEYVASPDVHYLHAAIPEGITIECQELFLKAGIAHPLCPVNIAAKFVRPATS